MERFFLEVGGPTSDLDVDPQDALASARRHGWEFIR
jgi:hypothetical protein